MNRKRWSGLSVVVVALGMTAACASGGVEGSDTSTTPTGAGSATTQVPNSPGPSAEGTSTTSCQKIIGHDVPGRGGLRVLDSVVFHRLSPSAPLGTSGEEGGLRYFAKVPVSVRSDAEVAISVPKDSRGALAISWASSPSPPGAEVIFEACGEDGGYEWTTYPGGFYFDERQCATIVITVGGTSTRQRVPLGAGCA